MKKILITGATDGVGLETAKLLASQGHYLLLHGRSETKMHSALQQIIAIAPDASVDTYMADLSKFSDIQRLSSTILGEHAKLDVLINNAGIFKTANPINQDGLDIRFVVNTIAPIMLTQSLLPIMSDEARIVNLSSAAQAPIQIPAILGQTKLNDDFQAYAQSKLALTIWTSQLSKTIKPKQVCIAVNPGSLLASKMVKEGFGVAGNDLSIGVQILVQAALATEFEEASGKYFDNDVKRFAEPHSFALTESNCDRVMKALDAVIASKV